MKILLASPVRQAPHILRQFLQSILELRKETFVLDCAFVDDNTDAESKAVLKEFAATAGNVRLFDPGVSGGNYVRDDFTHQWDDESIWKVAKFKDDLIEYALELEYDAIFLVDSDLVLHKETLEQLISDAKPIVAMVYWTAWQPGTPALPQVWVSDDYVLYRRHGREPLTDAEIERRTNEFLNQLRTPGLYEVGGLGACTLVSREAMLAGARFKQIDNLSLWGEDRHFCVRARALGLPLFADTHFPPQHLYRDEDADVPAFDYRVWWENNYAQGGTSGSGSYGRLAEFKAEIINDYIKDHGIQSVIEFGCGDGNQLKYMRYPQYLGLDVSKTSVRMCQQVFADDSSKSFSLYAPRKLGIGKLQADLVVCLDVLYHITDEADFVATLDDIFAAATKTVILYTKLGPAAPQSVAMVLDRDIDSYLHRYGALKRTVIPQRYPDESSASFLILEKVASEATDDKNISRYIRQSDRTIEPGVLPAPWWSRGREYMWARQHFERDHVVLDAACGISHPFKFWLSEACKEVHAVDLDARILSDEAILADITNDFGPETAKNVRDSNALAKVIRKQADITQLPYADSYFDRVFCISVLEHMSSDARLASAKEFARVLKPGGCVVVTFDVPPISPQELIADVLKDPRLELVSTFDPTLPSDALFTPMYSGLHCFRAILKKGTT